MCHHVIVLKANGVLSQIHYSGCHSDTNECTAINAYLGFPPGEECLLDDERHPLAGKEIGLFLLCSGPSLASLIGYIMHASLSNAPVFETLSWAWGDPSDIQQIVVNE